MSPILITGAAGFIGYHLTRRLLANDHGSLLSLDNYNSYYDPKLKRARTQHFRELSNRIDESQLNVQETDLRDSELVNKIVKESEISTICHLAAQAGVRYSLENPQSYIDNNLSATKNLLEASRRNEVNDIVFASTSSVYGLNTNMPFKETQSIDSTISTYSATKRACELLCHTYSHIYGFRFRILRFFTVYGPWGRPDMALFKFTNNILTDRPIDIYNHGRMKRDFTYIDDIIDGFIAAIDKPLDFEIINLGCGNPVKLMDFITILEKNLGKKAKKKMLPMQPGDVPATWADISKARELLDYKPKVQIEEGVQRFVEWYRGYCNV